MDPRICGRHQQQIRAFQSVRILHGRDLKVVKFQARSLSLRHNWVAALELWAAGTGQRFQPVSGQRIENQLKWPPAAIIRPGLGFFLQESNPGVAGAQVNARVTFRKAHFSSYYNRL